MGKRLEKITGKSRKRLGRKFDGKKFDAHASAYSKPSAEREKKKQKDKGKKVRVVKVRGRNAWDLYVRK